MTGTSLDGADLSLIKSNGINQITFLGGETFNFPNRLRSLLLSILGSNKRDSIIDFVEEEYTNFLIKKIKVFIKKRKEKINLIGLHGQTIKHSYIEKFTWQIGNALKIYNYFKIPVVYDFRKNDMIRGGNGAPLTPIFHSLLSKKYKIKKAIFVNLGGISNLTFVEKNKLVAFDCGPCCSLSNDFIKMKINKEYDSNGILASRGQVNKKIVKKLLKNKYFKSHIPKSLDRLDLKMKEINNLNVCDGLATINEFIANTLELGINLFSNEINSIIISGGGRKNQDLIKKIKNKFKFKFKLLLSDDLNIDGDLVESYAFAYLAIRSIKKLPISFPTTTGINKSASGGKVLG